MVPHADTDTTANTGGGRAGGAAECDTGFDAGGVPAVKAVEAVEEDADDIFLVGLIRLLRQLVERFPDLHAIASSPTRSAKGKGGHHTLLESLFHDFLMTVEGGGGECGGSEGGDVEHANMEQELLKVVTDPGMMKAVARDGMRSPLNEKVLTGVASATLANIASALDMDVGSLTLATPLTPANRKACSGVPAIGSVVQKLETIRCLVEPQWQVDKARRVGRRAVCDTPAARLACCQLLRALARGSSRNQGRVAELFGEFVAGTSAKQEGKSERRDALFDDHLFK